MNFSNPKYKKMFDRLLGACHQNFPSIDEKLLAKGFEFAIEAHKNDRRASGDEYITHPFEVALIVAQEIPLDEVTVVSALLHDTIEDTEISVELLQKEFGKEVAEIVDGVTKISGIFKGHEITQAENFRKLLLSMVKIVRRNKPFEEIYDLFAIRIILDTEDKNDCYTTLGIVNQMYPPVADRFKDYISIPKTNNYQSIHTTIVGPDGKLVEVQIRTRSTHEIAERGFAAHWRYKESKTTSDKDLENWVNWVRDIFESATKDEEKKDLIENFKLNLYQDEIYVFTPQGDLKRLPINSTPVDFAFEIHSKVGHHCIGAKVNGKIVPLDTRLHSGDQLEIIISKNQHPNKNWLKFAVTHKAKNAIRKYINKEEEEIVNAGKELWEKKLKKLKLSFNMEDIIRLAVSLKFEVTKHFFKSIAQGKLDLDDVLATTKEKEKKEKVSVLEFDSFASSARNTAGGILVDGKIDGILYSYAKCCNPIPGDPVIGFVTIGEGIKVHRKSCNNLSMIQEKNESKFITVQWPENESSLFVAGLKIVGKDSPGILNDISHAIVSYQNTNIKSVNISTADSSFDGSVTLYVHDISHLERIIESLKMIKIFYPSY